MSAAARPGPLGFPFPNPGVPLLFIHVDGNETSSARGSKMNGQVGCWQHLPHVGIYVADCPGTLCSPHGLNFKAH